MIRRLFPGRPSRRAKCPYTRRSRGEYERQLKTSMLAPPSVKPKEVPTFAVFAAEFMKTYVIANNKPSEQSAKARMLKQHLVPAFGDMRLDAIRMHPIECFKANEAEALFVLRRT